MITIVVVMQLVRSSSINSNNITGLARAARGWRRWLGGDLNRVREELKETEIVRKTNYSKHTSKYMSKHVSFLRSLTVGGNTADAVRVAPSCQEMG